MFDIITIGSATRDVFLKSSSFYVLKESHIFKNPVGCFVLGEKIVIDDIIFTTGGGAINSSVSFALKGLKTACICSVGDDFNGKSIIEELKNFGVDTSLVQIYKSEKTDYSTILHAPNGERTILVYKNASKKLSRDKIDHYKLKTKAFYISSLSGKLNLLNFILKNAKGINAYTAFNPGSKELKKGLDILKNYIKYVDLLILNLDEASYLTKQHKENIKEILKILSKLTIHYVLVTDGKNGSYVSNGRWYIFSSTFPEKQILDRTGAGDAFGSGFFYGLLKTKIFEKKLQDSTKEEELLKEAIRIANANATSVIENIGAKNKLLTENELEDKRWDIKYLHFKKEFL